MKSYTKNLTPQEMAIHILINLGEKIFIRGMSEHPHLDSVSIYLLLHHQRLYKNILYVRNDIDFNIFLHNMHLHS